MTEIQKKIQFVEKLRDALVEVQSNIEDIQYHVFGENGRHLYEFLVVEYKSGAISVRNCRESSCSVIFEELARLLETGYYDEVDWYESIAEKYERIYK